MSISNLLEPNNYDLFCNTISSGSGGTLLTNNVDSQPGNPLGLGLVGHPGISTNVYSDLQISPTQTLTSNKLFSNQNLTLSANPTIVLNSNTVMALGKSLSLPFATSNPYTITDSSQEIVTQISMSGATNSANSVKATIRKIGNWVDVNLRQTAPNTNVTIVNSPIIMVNALNSSPYYPPDIFVTDCKVFINGNYLDAELQVVTDGTVNIYYPSFPANWPVGASIGITTVCFSFCVL